MCGRFVIFSPYDVIKESFDISYSEADLSPNYNVCPTQFIPAVFKKNGSNILTVMHWGIVPSWAKDKSIAARMINARAETISEKPSFRNAFKKQRCLIPANGYYEWSGEKGKKQPHYIKPQHAELFAFAGLWERWIDKDSPDKPLLVSCTIVTTASSPSVQHIHNRMPVILSPQYYEDWLNAGLNDTGEINGIFQIGTVQEMTHYPVSKAVNTVKNNGPGLIQKLDV